MMKRSILIILLSVIATSKTSLHATCYTPKNETSFYNVLNDCNGQAAVYFYSSCGDDVQGHALAQKKNQVCSLTDKSQCKKAKQNLISHKKDWKIQWRKGTRHLNNLFCSVSDMYPSVNFIKVDLKFPKNRELARSLSITPDQPQYVLFEDGKPIEQRNVNMKTPSQSSLIRFVEQGFDLKSPYSYDCSNCDAFYPPPVKSFSVWDWGGPFYYDALFPNGNNFYYIANLT